MSTDNEPCALCGFPRSQHQLTTTHCPTSLYGHTFRETKFLPSIPPALTPEQHFANLTKR